MYLRPDEPDALLPGGDTVAWGFHVFLGLIGTISTGYILSPSDLSTTIGQVAAGALLFATAIAFTAAYLTASQMDERGGR